MELSPGAVVAGRYRVDRRVGAGGMGEVWAAEHLAIGIRVALKTLLGSAEGDHELVARFKREAVLLGRIRSDHVARVLDFVTDPRFGLVLVMEFVEGDSLRAVLEQRKLSVEEAIDLGADLAAALVDLHAAQIVHRDLKPGNVIMKPLADGRKRGILVDFGVSRKLSGGDDDEEMTNITRAGMAVGTIEYMAPEQILSSRDVRASADVYALGAILFRAVSGRHVFGDLYDADLAHAKIRNDPPRLTLRRSDRLAVGLAACVERATRRKPADRYPDAAEMLHDLTLLRDVARADALDLDTATTQDANGSAVLEAIALAPPASPGASMADMSGAHAAVAPASTPEPPRPPAPSISSVSSVSAASASLVGAPPRRAVHPLWYGAVAGALVAGAVGGAAWGRHAAPEPVASACPPAPSVVAAVASAPSATPSASAAASASASASAVAPASDTSAAAPQPSAIDLDSLDPASRAALEGKPIPPPLGGPLPKAAPSPAASGGLGAPSSAAGSGTAAPAPKPASSPAGSPHAPSTAATAAATPPPVGSIQF